MMKLPFMVLLLLSTLLLLCRQKSDTPAEDYTRSFQDTVGYAHAAWQMDSTIQRIDRIYGKQRQNTFYIQEITPSNNWRIAICPHDDYSYAGGIYTYVLSNLKTPVIIIFGVAHRARNFGIENRLVFDSYTQWQAPYGPVKISPLRQEIMEKLPEDMVMVNDSLQQVEHSVEALLPFLQYYQRDVRIVSILVTAMNFERMQQIGQSLAKAIQEATQDRQWEWGRDYSLVISNDCVHYGDEDWGGKNYAPFGADTAGYRAATNYDMNIISECLIDQLEPQRIRRFYEYTIDINDFREYAWTWCGRYSLTVGLLTAYQLQNLTKKNPLEGRMLRYGTSISHTPIPVNDLGMGVTAPANIHHWVGYVAIGYRPQ
jgi:AmmeMemoRadiSam system protein B